VNRLRLNGARAAPYDGGRTGAIVIGAPPIGLTITRSLGRNGIPVCVLHDENHRVAATSRFTCFSSAWPSSDESQRVDYLLSLAETRRLMGWTLFPTDDETAAFLARQHELLSERFLVASPPWNVLHHAYDKRMTYGLAAELGVPFPPTFYPRTRDEVSQLDCRFPVILKPAAKPEQNRFTYAKAWLAEDMESLQRGYEEACACVPPELVMVQELIPGGGEAQFSYAALCENGTPLATLVARRTRQYPTDFGRASSFVETVEEQAIEEPARRLLEALRLTGIVEVEFKRDPRDGVHKLLDINARAWAWVALGARAGVDFPYLFWRLLHGDPPSPVRASAAVRWMRPATDLAAAAVEIADGRLTPNAYLRTLQRPLVFAVFAKDDPLPAILEAPFLASVMYKQFIGWRTNGRRRSRR
jgi:predicted ATP-grasp superfamily ATP-dependent carboligase